jgi:hypothetical protein
MAVSFLGLLDPHRKTRRVERRFPPVGSILGAGMVMDRRCGGRVILAVETLALG